MSKKYSFLSLKRKLEVIEELNQPHPPSKRSLGRKFGVDESAIRSIWKKKDLILKTAESMSPDHLFNRTRASAPKFPLLEDRLCGWIDKCIEHNLSLSPNQVISQAKLIAEELLIPHEDFKASPGWFKRFKERRGLKYTNFHSEDLVLYESKGQIETNPCTLLETYTGITTGLKYQMLENRLYEWICESNQVNLRLSLRLTILKAKVLAEELAIPPKDFTSDWFEQFIERKSLKEIEFHEEEDASSDALSHNYAHIIDEACGDFSAHQDLHNAIEVPCPRILPGKARVDSKSVVDNTEVQHSNGKEDFSTQLNTSSSSTSQQFQESTNNTVNFEGFHTIYSNTIKLQNQLCSPQAQTTSGELYNEIMSSFEQFQNVIRRALVKETNLVSEET